MDVADFDFELPEALIAQEPSPERGGSRLLRLSRGTGDVSHTTFSKLPELLEAGDVLVLNNTRVFPARLLGHRVPSGGAVECLLLAKLESGDWDALVHPGQKLKPGAHVVFGSDEVRLEGEIRASHFFGRRTVRLWTSFAGGVEQAIDRIGHIPLPPYIRRDDQPADHERYQTVYARTRGSVAAPTAGLHFTPQVLDALKSRGVEIQELTLHVGYGTFKPVRVGRVEEHEVDGEEFSVSAATAAALTRAKHEGRRIIAVGTTTARALESLTVTGGIVREGAGITRLFIYPGHRFELVNGMITNFHLPRSSLLMLVSALGGRDRVLSAYREAVREGYRFYSYGDAMFLA